MTAETYNGNGNDNCTASWLGDGLYPTHRKVRDEWGTRHPGEVRR
jgi:hypothetical protein